MYPSKFGEQPIKTIMRGRVPRWTITDLLKKLPADVSWTHARFVLDGRTPPSLTLREHLPAILGVPLRDLFTTAALAATYRPDGNGGSDRISTTAAVHSNAAQRSHSNSADAKEERHESV